MRKKIIVTIESDDNQASVAVVPLLRKQAFNCNYELEINYESSYKYEEPLDKPYFADCPVCCMNFYYHFAQLDNQEPLEAFQELEAFAAAYAPHIKQVMTNSGQFTNRMRATQDTALMHIARGNADIRMDELRRKLTSTTSYNPQFFSTVAKNLQHWLTQENNFYLICGVGGLIIALSAMTTPFGLAITLACIGALFFAGGGVGFIKNKLATNNVTPEPTAPAPAPAP